MGSCILLDVLQKIVTSSDDDLRSWWQWAAAFWHPTCPKGYSSPHRGLYKAARNSEDSLQSLLSHMQCLSLLAVVQLTVYCRQGRAVTGRAFEHGSVFS